MINETVTVIVPIFNAEKTLHRCLNSITKQTYPHLDIILIDDGSTDKSADICRMYKQDDRRITLITQENTGPAKARNEGIKRASGNFIQFVDADDHIKSNMTEQLIKLIAKNDLVICGYATHSQIIQPHIRGSYSKTNTIEHFGQLYKDTIVQSPCNKLYKKAIISDNELTFQKNYSFGEDLRFNLAYITHCERIFFTQQTLYIYEQNKHSLTNSYIDNLLEKQLTIHKDVYRFLLQNDGQTDENLSNVNEMFLRSIIQTATNIIHPNSPYEKSEQKRQLQKLISNQRVTNNLAHRPHKIQGRLFKCLIQRQAATRILILLRMKEELRKRGPVLFNILKRLNLKEGHR